MAFVPFMQRRKKLAKLKKFNQKVKAAEKRVNALLLKRMHELSKDKAVMDSIDEEIEREHGR
jgi:hypothetical protein